MIDPQMEHFAISALTFRRFILGRQGLWPGRRFSGLEGTLKALNEMEAVQLDPLNVVARSQDIALWGRVLDYRPAHLHQVAYEQRQFFDYGGGLFLYPMSELPYWTHAMQRVRQHPRWGRYMAENPELISQVLSALRERGPLGNRDFAGNPVARAYRGRKDTALALYALWLTGDVMIHHRQGFDRVYALRESVVPPEYAQAASEQQAIEYFARKSIAFLGLVREKRWAANLSAYLDRKLDEKEASQYLSAFYQQGLIVPLQVEGSNETWLVLGADVPLLNTLETGATPASWQPLGPTTLDEVTFLAPLEIVSARGRAKQVFGFDYIWEVYKPVEQRRWGYYTLPILYGDRLVARIDPRLDRKTGTLQIKGLWLEDEASAADSAFVTAFARGLLRFSQFTGASQIDLTTLPATPLTGALSASL